MYIKCTVSNEKEEETRRIQIFTLHTCAALQEINFDTFLGSCFESIALCWLIASYCSGWYPYHPYLLPRSTVLKFGSQLLF